MGYSKNKFGIVKNSFYLCGIQKTENMNHIDFWVEKKMDLFKKGCFAFDIHVVDVSEKEFEQIKESDFLISTCTLPISQKALKRLGVKKVLKYNGIFWLLRIY